MKEFTKQEIEQLVDAIEKSLDKSLEGTLGESEVPPEIKFRNLLGDKDIPEKVYLVYCPQPNKYLCFSLEYLNGLAAFTSERGVYSYTDFVVDFPSFDIKEVSFDEAVELARTKEALKAIHIVDSANTKPKIFYL